MGHEVCGVVAAVGAGVDRGWWARASCPRRTTRPAASAGSAATGARTCARERRSIGSFADGAFAPRVVVPAHGPAPHPGLARRHAAALTEPLACVCQCLCDPPAVTAGDACSSPGRARSGCSPRRRRGRSGGDVLVLGLPSDARAAGDGARRSGFETRRRARTGRRVRRRRRVLGRAGGAAACLEAAARGGRYVQVGVFGRPVTVPLDHVFAKELVVTLGVRLDAALLAAGADADRAAGGASSSRWSARWYPSTRGSARSGTCAREGA